jgi:hypothetical protein
MTWQATSAAVWRSSWGSACLACLVRVGSPRHYLASPWKTRQPSNINAVWLALVRLFVPEPDRNQGRGRLFLTKYLPRG